MIDGIRVCVVSHARPQNVAKMQAKTAYPIHWYVNHGEREAYESAGATHITEGNGLIPSRNQGMEDAFAEGKICLQMDDDYLSAYVANGPHGAIKCTRITLDELIERLVSKFLTSKALCSGCAPTDNKLGIDRDISESAFIIASFFAAKPNPLRFDESLRMKEDYDYTLQHLSKYGRVLRMNRLMPVFAHYDNSGGWKSYRSTATEQAAIARLREKWPAFIKPHPRRANEIILKFP